MSVIVRFAPSPTGPLHLGSARTALFNYLFAKQQGGQIFLRIEDTDRARSQPEFEQNILESLKWLVLTCDDFYRQSERKAIYAKYLKRLVDGGKAYSGLGESVIRLRNPGQSVSFTDLIRGEITFDTTELGDFIIAKSLDEPLYHFAVVVDDWRSHVTHVIRGEDHISNTPRQILIQAALDAPRPVFAHIPLILAPDRSKLSKRHGAVSVTEYRKQGYLPDALINYLALLGWNPGTDQEIFSLTELINQFSLTKVQKGGAVFNLDKLNWLNREYLKHWSDEMIIKHWPSGLDRSLAPKIVSLLRDRIVTVNDIARLIESEDLSYFFRQPIYLRELLKNQKHFTALQRLIKSIPDDNFTAAQIKTVIFPYAVKEGKGEVLWPLRVALTGREKSPDPFTVAAILGKSETLARLDHAARSV